MLHDDDFQNEIDAMVAALQAKGGWDKPAARPEAITAEEMAIERRLLGETNARRSVKARQHGRRHRVAKAAEVYAVQNSRGWVVGAIEDNQNRVIFRDLDLIACRRFLAMARERNYNVVIHHNPMRTPEPAEDFRPTRMNRLSRPAEPKEPHHFSTPSKHVKPTKAREIMAQLTGYKS